MIWHNLRLRTRLLIGYGLMFVLIAALIFFLLLRSHMLNAQIQNLNVAVATETAASARLASQVATTQQTVDRYLQQPRPANQRMAMASLAKLASEIAKERTALVSPLQRQRLDALSNELTVYQDNFRSLSRLLETQETIRVALNKSLLDASSAMHEVITQYLNQGKADPQTLGLLVRAQRSQQLAIFWNARLVTEQQQGLGSVTLGELDSVDFNLKLRRNLVDQATGSAIDHVQENRQRSTEAIKQYMANRRYASSAISSSTSRAGSSRARPTLSPARHWTGWRKPPTTWNVRVSRRNSLPWWRWC